MTGWSTARSACFASSTRRRRSCRWIDEGDAADLRFTGDGKARALGARRARRRRHRRSARRAALEAAARRRHGFDHHRPGMHRRARRLCGPQGQGRADHRARDAGRARFSSGALRERVRLLAGLDERELKRCLDERVHVTAGAETLVQTMRAGGASCLLVSGGFLSFAEPVARTVGFDRVKANRLVFAGGKLSRRGRRSDRRRHGQARGARRSSRRARPEAGETCSRSATAPTTS